MRNGLHAAALSPAVLCVCMRGRASRSVTVELAVADDSKRHCGNQAQVAHSIPSHWLLTKLALLTAERNRVIGML